MAHPNTVKQSIRILLWHNLNTIQKINKNLVMRVYLRSNISKWFARYRPRPTRSLFDP